MAQSTVQRWLISEPSFFVWNIKNTQGHKYLNMKFDSIYEQLLTELFNTKQKVDWDFNEGSFETIVQGPNETDFMLSLHPFWEMNIDAAAFNTKALRPEQWKTLEHGTWLVEFADVESGDMTEITGEQGMSSSQVFSLIGNALLEKVKKDPTVFKNIVFAAQEPSRRSLYARMAPILAKKLNKDLAISDNGGWFFIITK